MKIVFNVVKNTFLVFLKKPWFQKQLVKQITNFLEMANSSDSKVDNVLLDFVKENKEQLLLIAKQEASKSDSIIDEILVKTLENVKTN